MDQTLPDLGPVLPSRLAVLAQARELKALADRAVEFSGSGPTADLTLALAQLERMRAVLGVKEEAACLWWMGRTDCEDCLALEKPVCTMNCSSARRVDGEPYPGRIRCGCASEVVHRVQQGGVCGMGGCPYGGDF